MRSAVNGVVLIKYVQLASWQQQYFHMLNHWRIRFFSNKRSIVWFIFRYLFYLLKHHPNLFQSINLLHDCSIIRHVPWKR